MTNHEKRRGVEAAPPEIDGLLVVQGAWESLMPEKTGESWRLKLLKVKMRAAKTEKPARKPMSAGLALGE